MNTQELEVLYEQVIEIRIAGIGIKNGISHFGLLVGLERRVVVDGEVDFQDFQKIRSNKKAKGEMTTELILDELMFNLGVNIVKFPPERINAPIQPTETEHTPLNQTTPEQNEECRASRIERLFRELRYGSNTFLGRCFPRKGADVPTTPEMPLSTSLNDKH